MTYPTISEYVESILSAEDNFKELTNLRPVLKADGTPYMTSGNFAVVFKMREEDTGKLFAVKCFLKEQEKRTESYKLISEELEYVQSSYLVHIRYMEDELFVDSANSDQNEFPILLMDWVEGEPLDAYLRKNLYDEYARKMLAYRFCAMSSWLMSQPFAHGDLKPDNILVREDGTLVLVDYDGMFVPAMKGQTARELGSPDFRHPLRDNTDFDEHIDDFSIASIALSLKALSLDADLLDKYGDKDRLLFSQTDYQNIAASQTIDAMQSLLADVEFERLMGVFLMAHSMKNLSAISFRTVQIRKPVKVEFVQLKNFVSNGKLFLGTLTHKTTKEKFPCLRVLSPEGKETYIFFAKSLNNGLTMEQIEEQADNLQVATVSSFNEETGERRITHFLCRSNSSWQEVQIGNPEKVEREQLSTEVTEEDIENGIEDEYGVIYSRDGRRLLKCKNYKLGKYVIKSETRVICDSAFGGCRVLTCIEIPDSVTSIGNSAFDYCSSLTSMKIPNSVTSIGDSAFKNCWYLTSINIPDSVMSIGKLAFYDCKKLTNINISGSVMSIGYLAFGHSGLTSINVSVKNRYYDSRENCNAIIESKTNKLIAGCAKTKVPNSVTSIGDSAFEDCSGLTSIEIPDSVTSIGDRAFEACRELANIEIPNSVTSIGERTFEYCEKLTSMEIPSSVTSIGERAFVGCRGLTSINVSIKNRCYDSRENCNAIIESKTNKLISGCANTKVPNSVTSIGNNAFEGCSGLTSIEIPDSVTSIGNNAFEGCSGLTSIEIPDSVMSIGNSAFIRCEKLTNIAIPDSVTSIGDFAFFGCSELTNIKIPDSVTSIGDRAFSCCSGLISIEIPDSVTSIGEASFSCCCRLTSIEIPDSVMSIENSAFECCEKLTNIEIPDSVTSIEDDAFFGCSELTNIKIPDSVMSIGDRAFSGCSGLISIEIPDSVTSIGDFAFSRCGGLTSIVIPDSVTSIGPGAFRNCRGLTSINVSVKNQYYDSRENCNAIIESKTNKLIAGCVNTKIPDSVTSIGAFAFSSCYGLPNIMIPDSVTSIGEYAFEDCWELTSIKIPGSVTSIGNNAFEGCSGLTSIEIPDSVMSIGTEAFVGCDGLIKVKVSPKNKFYHTNDDGTELIETKTGWRIWSRRIF